jgi:hypothetical protein
MDAIKREKRLQGGTRSIVLGLSVNVVRIGQKRASFFRCSSQISDAATGEKLLLTIPCTRRLQVCRKMNACACMQYKRDDDGCEIARQSVYPSVDCFEDVVVGRPPFPFDIGPKKKTRLKRFEKKWEFEFSASVANRVSLRG